MPGPASHTNPDQDVDAFLGRVRSRPDRALVALDVDGTVSEIVASPEDAVVEEPLRETLTQLSGLVHLWFVSGRDADRARSIVGVATAGYVGSHGLEALDRGGLRPLGDVRDASEKLERLAAAVAADVPEVTPYVERKRWSVAFHYRAFPADSSVPERLRRSIASQLTPALRLRPGKKVAEVVPVVDRDKGTALAWLIRETQAESALVAGDDLTDVAMFDSVKNIRTNSTLDGLCVAVRHGEETPEEVITAADTAVGGVEGLQRLLRKLLEAPSSP